MTIVQNVVLAYRERFYQLLRDYLAAAGVDLVLVHSNPTASRDAWQDSVELSWAHRVRKRVIRVGGKEVVWQPYVQLVRAADLVIVEQASRLILNYRLVAAQRLGRQHVAFWGHGKNFAQDGRSRSGEAAKRWLSRQAHWWFAYTEESAKIITLTGFPPERVTVVRNATDSRRLTEAMTRPDESEIATLRAELGLRGMNVGMYLGGLGDDKRLDFLVRAADDVRAAIPDFELVVAGAGPRQADIVSAASERPWMVHVGRCDGDDLARLMCLPKLLLVPVWAGLVVVDSFAAAVPLVASGSASHPPEIAYLRDGVNGVLVDDGGDTAVYAQAVAALLRDESRRKDLVRGCERARAVYSAEDMAARFADGVLAALRIAGSPAVGTAPNPRAQPSIDEEVS